MVQPTPEVMQSHGLKKPDRFTREEFGKLMVNVHRECGVEIVETACFMEPHANGLMHHNCLARAVVQYKWKQVAETLFKKYKVSVSFGTNIHTWAEGVVYGCVASEHKGPEALDQTPTQWAKGGGTPAKLEEHIPRQWKTVGFVRKTKMTWLAFLGVCREHNVETEAQLWALATELEEKGDKGLLAFLGENDAGKELCKARKAMEAKETVRREKLTRLDILEECARTAVCTCPSPGLCYTLIKDNLVKNQMDGEFQKEVCDTLEAGRQKMRNLCVVGSTNMAKSFLFKPLALIYRTYTRPDGGNYQLEELLGKELVFLNDFEYNEDAKKWCAWGYFKNFLEGCKLTVGVPKQKGSNQEFTSDAPVFMTAAQEVALYRGKKRDAYETEQMESRIKYLKLSHTFKEEDRVEAKECAKCGAQVYLEGRRAPAQGFGVSPPQATVSGAASSSSRAGVPQTAAPQPSTGQGMVQALKDLKELKDAKLLDSPELQRLKAKVLRGE